MGQPPFAGDYNGLAYAYEDLTVSTSAVGFTAANLIDTGDTNLPAIAVDFTTDQPVRMRLDGGNPTSTSGIKIPAGGPYTISGSRNLVNAKFIKDATASGSATVNSQYMRS